MEEKPATKRPKKAVAEPSVMSKHLHPSDDVEEKPTTKRPKKAVAEPSVVSKHPHPSDDVEEKPATKRPKKAVAKESSGEGPTVKKASLVKSSQAKSALRLVKESCADTMPKTAYPPELGYSNGKDVRKGENITVY